MTNEERKVIELALEALEDIKDDCSGCEFEWSNDYPLQAKAHTAIKEVLARGEQEPVAVKHMMEWVDYLKRKSDYGQHLQISSEMSAGACWDLARELEQFINTTPPQRKPLTDGEMDAVIDGCPKYHGRFSTKDPNGKLNYYELIRAIEAAHGIKE